LPLSSYAADIKLAHVGAVIASGALFFGRGTLVLAGRQARAMTASLRYLSYSIDTILLLGGLLLVAILPVATWGNGWLWVKLLLLPVYVALGWMALHKAPTRGARFGFFVAAILTYVFMASIARAHHPLGALRPSLDAQTSEVSTDCYDWPVSAPASTGVAQLSWNVPTTRTDGSPLYDLAGYRIKYGITPDKLPCLVEIRDPKVTTWKVTGLSPGTWYFAVASLDSGSAESDLSGVVSKRID
jgi:uncharacterized membrane protein SirB2